MGSKTASVTKAEYETLAALRYSLRQFLRFSEEAAQAAGLTPQQHQALLAIKGFAGPGPIGIGELAERLQVRHHSAVGLVDRLVARRLAVRRRSNDDRRKISLVLTARGEAVLEKLSATHKDQLRRMAPHIESLLRGLRGNSSNGPPTEVETQP